MIKWGQNSKPKKSLGLQTKPKKNPRKKINPKNPMPNLRATKISRETMQPEYVATIMNLQIVLNTL